jgi:hypothetical protein
VVEAAFACFEGFFDRVYSVERLHTSSVDFAGVRRGSGLGLRAGMGWAGGEFWIFCSKM